MSIYQSGKFYKYLDKLGILNILFGFESSELPIKDSDSLSSCVKTYLRICLIPSVKLHGFESETGIIYIYTFARSILKDKLIEAITGGK